MELPYALVQELARTRTIDMTTIGRRSGLARRIEIWWFHIDGRFIITGTPGARDWLANLNSDPRLTIHAAGFDLAAVAREVRDPDLRRRVFTDMTTRWYRSMAELDDLVARAPMVEVDFEGSPPIP